MALVASSMASYPLGAYTMEIVTIDTDAGGGAGGETFRPRMQRPVAIYGQTVAGAPLSFTINLTTGVVTINTALGATLATPILVFGR